MSELPNELEYVSDFSAQENFRQSYRIQLNRCLILMINEPNNSYELALQGLDILLDYYKDATYIDDIDEISHEHLKELEKFKLEERRGTNITNKTENLRFTYNNKRFRSLMRLAGRSSFLPFPPIAVKIGGKNPELNYKDEPVTTEDVEDLSKVIDKTLELSQDLKNMAIGVLANKDFKDKKEDSNVSSTSKRKV